MVAIAAVVVLVVVVAGVTWARLAASRAERRSLIGYEKSLDLLGDVAKRSEAVADVNAPLADDLAKPHVRQSPGAKFPGPAPSAVRMLPPPRVRLTPPVLPGSPPGQVPVFGDADLVGSPRAAQAPPEAPLRPSALPEAPLVDIVAATRAALRPNAGAPAPGLSGTGVPPEAPSVLDPPTEIYAVAPAPSEEAPTVASPVEKSANGGQDALAGGAGITFFDFDDTGNVPGVAVEAESSPPGRLELARTARGRGAGSAAGGGSSEGSERVRRAATGAAAAVVVGAIAVGGWQLASHRSSSVVAANQPTSTSSPPANSTGHASGTSGSSRKSTSTSPAPAVPTTLQPTSTSASLVTYRMPAGPYTVSFKATSGACWLGAQSRASSSAYLQMWTLQPGQSASYAASGPLVIKIGAPHYVAITVDGKPVILPSFATPYDISFSGSSGTAA